MPEARSTNRTGPLMLAMRSGPPGAARRADGGKTWQDVALRQGATLVEAHPPEAGTLYAGVHDGGTVQVLVSRDGGMRWSPP